MQFFHVVDYVMNNFQLIDSLFVHVNGIEHVALL